LTNNFGNGLAGHSAFPDEKQLAQAVAPAMITDFVHQNSSDY
jgi:hypothetical protein